MSSIWEQITGTAEDAFNAGKEWAGGVVDDVKDAATNFAIDQVMDNIKDQYSFEDAFVTYDKLTPELEAAGWKEGLDGQPYNAQLAIDFAPGGKFYDPDVDKNITPRPGAIGPDFVANNTATTSGPFLSQDLRQRTPSGTIYNPSMEAFNNASLFNYKGPGGAAEYTYGQGLPMGYGTYGTPPGPNLYYEGQFGEGYKESQVADNAINLPPVTMPDGVPQIPAPKPTQPNMPGFTSGGSVNDKVQYENEILNSNVGSGLNPNFLVSQADQGPDIGLLNYTNNGTVSAADQAIFDAAKMEKFNPTGGPSIYDTQYTVGANNAMSPVGPSIYDTQYTVGANNAMSPIGPSIYDTQYTVGANNVMSPIGPSIYETMTSPTMLGGEEQVFEGPYNMTVNDDGTFSYGNSQSNQGNFETANQTVENDSYISDLPIVESDINNLNIFQDTGDEEVVISTPLGDLTQSDIDNMVSNAVTINLDQSYASDNYSPAPKYGLDEAVVDSGKYIYDVLTSGNTSNANAGFVQAVAPTATTTGYAGNIQINPFTLDMSPSEIAYQDAVANPVVQTVVNPQPLPSFINEDSGNQEGKEMYEMFKEGLLADDMMIGSNYLGIDDNPKPAPVTVSIPSIFRPPAPRPTPAPTVFASPGGAPGYTSYGPPNFQLVGGR